MKKPDIIIFNPDQWRGDALGHAGNPAAYTPNLDQFVKEDAVSFTKTFCQSPVCTPSRCSFMTGWYPHVHGHRTMFHMLHPEQGDANLLKILKDNGYFVWWGGKNDLTPGQDGIDDYCDIRFFPTEEDFKRWGSMPREGNHGGDLAWRGSPDGDNFYSFFKGKLDKGDDEVYCDSDWVNIFGAMDFIRNYQGDKPLCIYIPLNYPHPPYCVEEPWYSIINREKLPRRAQPPENWEGKPSILKGIWENQRLQSWAEERWNELRATYYGMGARVDHQFGLIKSTLKESNQYDNAAIFFFSDHGDYTGDFGIVEKTQNTFEDCLTRVPFIVKAPKEMDVKPRISDALVELTDFSATVYDLTGVDPGYDSFGRSLLPFLCGETDVHRDVVFSEGGRRYGETQAMEHEALTEENDMSPLSLYGPRIRLQATDNGPYHTKAAMCRTQDYKYVRRLYEQDEFYDLVADPLEEKNLINDPSYQHKIIELKELLLTWYMETCDIVPKIADMR